MEAGSLAEGAGFSADDEDGSEELEGRPEARTTAPLARERMSVEVTPGFWARRVRSAVVSSGCGGYGIS